MLPSEITSTFTSVAAECFSATHLINQFDAYQECYPEEIWRLDIQRKYIRTFTGESIDNSKPKHDVQYLRDMMQGRKKYQRRQWVRDQEIYFGTKNLMNTVVGDNNRITFRCFTPTGDDVVVKPDYTLKITPYSDMYLSVMFGNGGTQQIRAKGGKEYTIDCPLSTMDDTQVTIYGANRIQALSDLSACYIAANNFSMATKLRKLVLGNTTKGYSNPRLTSLTIGNNELLEELDIRNCGNLTGSLNLAQCNNLLKLYAEGTKITGAIFATNGKIQLAHLPETINTLTMRNLDGLTDFVCSMTALETLTLQGGTLDSLDIVTKTIGTLRALYLYDIAWTVGETTLLNKMLKLFFSSVSGSVYVSGGIRLKEIENYNRAWSDLSVTYNPDNLVPQYLYTFVNYDGKTLYEMWVDRGSQPEDPVAAGYINAPTRPSDAQYNYTFSGWDDLDGAALSAKTVTAQYNTALRKYMVTWYSREGVSIKQKEAYYGEEAVYDGEIPTNTSEESSYIYSLFTGWDKNTGFITGDTDVYAIWDKAELPSIGKELSTMSVSEIYGVATSGKAADYFELKDYIDIPIGTDFNFKNVSSKLICENKYFDGTTAMDTDIVLLGPDSPSFTLVADFEFGTTETNATLLSAFEEDGSEGFRLRYNTSPNIQWGDKSASVGYGQQKGLCVIRHRKGSDTLFVYATNLGNGIYNDDITSYELVRTRNTQTTVTLTLGAVKFGDGEYDYYGKGWINWCKIWYDDLGDANARELAIWNHEIWRAEYCDTERYRLAGKTVQKCNASFILNNALDLGHRMNPTNSNVGGWDASEMRTFLNNRILKALPVAWRNIIKKVKISASAGNQSKEILVSEDRIYLPSYVEVGSVQTEPYASEGTLIKWFTSNQTRLKFRGQILSDDLTFHTTETDPTMLTTVTVKPGDIWINTSNQSIGYLYIPKEVWAKHWYYDSTNNIVASDGGLWLRAHYWWESSPHVDSSTYFIYVGISGWPDGNGYATGTIAVVPCFSI